MFKTTNRTALLASAAIVALPVAFETKAGWKMDGDKLALDGSGNPIYVATDGKEQSVDGGTISRLNGEAMTHRKAKETAESALEKYKDADGKLIDPQAATKALELVGKLDAKQLIDAGEVDKVKEEVAKGYTAQITERDGRITDLQGRVDTMTKQTAFATSNFIRDRVAVPPEMFTATFERNFKVEDGKIVPYDASGNKIFSKKRMGEIADVDEAFEILLDTYPHKDNVLKAPNAGGSGNGGGGGARGGGRVMNRADFDKLGPAQQSEAAGLAAKGELTLTD